MITLFGRQQPAASIWLTILGCKWSLVQIQSPRLQKAPRLLAKATLRGLRFSGRVAAWVAALRSNRRAAAKADARGERPGGRMYLRPHAERRETTTRCRQERLGLQRSPWTRTHA